jgi:dTDP-4-amino-4,6-dideoxygalactose transaminase
VNVPLLDLVAQYQSVRDAVLPALMAVVERQGFIMGPEVGQLETQIARLSQARHGIACASDRRASPLRAMGLAASHHAGLNVLRHAGDPQRARPCS